ncbi:MAG: hypothetical protein M1831_007507 [Alyxoria varia]|nr:MAG: hypothetical protein M1831_007507 [Alyxoria varia]
MEKAKQATSHFLKRDGHHDTTVDQRVAPEVVNETVNTHNRQEVQRAVDKEVHQDHYHNTVQPVHDRDILPEQHSHNLAQQEHRQYKHGDNDQTKERIARDQAQFQNQRTMGHTQEERVEAPTVGGEHVHHHVHENIQPVVQKETIQPNVVHTTVPVHEEHYNSAVHHNTSALPAVSMSEYKSGGGALGGSGHKTEKFDGHPKISSGLESAKDYHTSDTGYGSSNRTGGIGSNDPTRSAGMTDSTHSGPGHRSHDPTTRSGVGSGTDGYRSNDPTRSGGLTDSSRTGHGGYDSHDPTSRNTHSSNRTDGYGGPGSKNPISSTLGSSRDSNSRTDHPSTNNGLTSSDPTTKPGRGPGADGYGGHTTDLDPPGYPTTSTTSTAGTGKHGTTAPAHKPTLMEKLNPKVDSNGDGKAGFMK